MTHSVPYIDWFNEVLIDQMTWLSIGDDSAMDGPLVKRNRSASEPKVNALQSNLKLAIVRRKAWGHLHTLDRAMSSSRLVAIRTLLLDRRKTSNQGVIRASMPSLLADNEVFDRNIPNNKCQALNPLVQRSCRFILLVEECLACRVRAV
jgi:hypothetical protein